MKNSLILLILVHFLGYTDAQVYINEVMSNNQNTVIDNDDNYSDWIEIYNSGTSAINLQGYFLSDDPDSMSKWRIPNITIQPGSFFIFWCSSKNDGSVVNPHTNFSLSSHNENIFLSDPAGSIIDNVPIGNLVADKSIGRLPDGSSNLVYLSEPSFNSTNNNAILINGIVNAVPQFNIPGGFYISSQNIILTHPDASVSIHYTLDGSDPTEYSPVYSGPINVHSRVGEANYYSTIRTCYHRHNYRFSPLCCNLGINEPDVGDWPNDHRIKGTKAERFGRTFPPTH